MYHLHMSTIIHKQERFDTMAKKKEMNFNYYGQYNVRYSLQLLFLFTYITNEGQHYKINNLSHVQYRKLPILTYLKFHQNYVLS